ncbi:hypothetical protein RhiirA4_478079 [Rhizophagus irregularis]|uniref:Uncharacterized protein n=1 Tax=Rhizophagus irregularis TaxID=588596 RepID=A0A2I1HE69_9GLOM|nr:hypothetical protein RhiirA4_478079 [Rhizophagus irregularis]
MNTDESRISNKAAVDFVSKFNEIYFRSISHILGSFVQDGFLKELFKKNPSVPTDKAQLLIMRSWDNFSSQFLSEFGDIHVGSDEENDMLDDSSVDEPDVDDDLGNFSEEDLLKLGIQMPPPPKPAIVTPPILPDIVMTPVVLPVTPETSRKKDKQKRVFQTINKSRTNQQRQNLTPKRQPKTPKRRRNHLNLR